MALKRKRCDLPAEAAAELPEEKKPKKQVVLSDLPAEAVEPPERAQALAKTKRTQALAKTKLRAAIKAQELMRLRVQQQRAVYMSHADYLKVYYANVKDAGGKQAHKQRRAAIKAQARAQALAKTKLRAAIKAQKRAQVLARSLIIGKDKASRRDQGATACSSIGKDTASRRDQFRARWSKHGCTGVGRACSARHGAGVLRFYRERVHGDNDVQVCAHAVRTSSNQQTGFGFFDMEGKCDKTGTVIGTGALLPYSASLAGTDRAGKDVQKTWRMYPLSGGAGATLKDCEVYLKNSTLNPKP